MQVMIDTDHDIKIIHMKYFSSVRRTEDNKTVYSRLSIVLLIFVFEVNIIPFPDCIYLSY